LLATQIASRVQKTLQRDVPLRAMFECSTVAELAEYIEGLAANPNTGRYLAGNAAFKRLSASGRILLHMRK